LKIAALALALGAGGCVLPEETKVTAGHKYSRESLAFLDLPGTTREEVIASLGPPLLESRDSRTLLYVWETTSRWLLIPPQGPDVGGEPLFETQPIQHHHPREWGLFIACDERGIVSAHEVRRVGVGTLEEACAEWNRERNVKH
jgi:outer membrane protein assembly factor BamE (lipoprotein component of BamABCDE complex)